MRIQVLFFVFQLLIGSAVLADGAPQLAYAQELQDIAKVSELRSLETAEVSRRSQQHEKVDKAQVFQESKMAPRFASDDSKDTISDLLDQVERLKTKAIVDKRNQATTLTPKRASNVGSKTVYPFIEGRLYEVHCGVDKVTDVALEPGEKLTNTPMAGDTVRWKIGMLTSGSKEGEVSHLVIKPLEDDLETNLLVTTNRRVYHLRLQSGNWYMPTVSWHYPENEVLKAELLENKSKNEEALSLPPEKLRFDYEIEGKDYNWRPEIIFDDGAKTYLRMPSKISGTEAPALFVINEDDEAMLVNYRVKGQFYIVDGVFDRAELKIGSESKLTVYSPRYERGFFERNF